MSRMGAARLVMNMSALAIVHGFFHQCPDYPFFNDEDRANYLSEDPCRVDLDIIHSYKEKRTKLQLSRMTLLRNRAIRFHSDYRSDLQLVVFGKTGQGKSSTGNIILNGDIFEEGYGHKSETRKVKLGSAVFNGRTVRVLDTPGLHDTGSSLEETEKQISSLFHYFDRIDAFLLVMNLADPRFTTEDAQVIGRLQDILGRSFLDHCILVLTHGKDLRVDLDEYLSHQREVAGVHRGQTISERADDSVSSFVDLLDAVSWRVVAIDTHMCSTPERTRHRNTIIGMVDQMRTLNHPWFSSRGK